MLTPQAKTKIKELWSNYLKQDKKTRDLKGNIFEQIDKDRLNAIEDIKIIIQSFMVAESDVYSFKTTLDSYNKKNNLWGFTAIKGQMFFNQLVKTYESNIEHLTTLLKDTIKEPVNLVEALIKIEKLETELQKSYVSAPDKRKVPKPSSVGYFLSYFWQIHNREKWAIMFTSMITTFEEIGIWQDHETQKETYKYFYNLNEEIKKYLTKETKTKISNWDVEHCFWDLHLQSIRVEKESIIKTNSEEIDNNQKESTEKITTANFDINDYLIPKVSNLVQLGEDENKSASEKGSLFEKKVAEVFKLLDFEVKLLGQGKGRNPDAILTHREERIAFIVDAKAYANGYNLGLDDRAIREYINHYCPALKKDGYTRIGFIIVSNSFKSNFEAFINDVTWNTDIKRFILVTSNALLHLLAYKTKNNFSVSQVIESLIKLGTIITEKEIIEEFEDV